MPGTSLRALWGMKILKRSLVRAGRKNGDNAIYAGRRRRPVLFKPPPIVGVLTMRLIYAGRREHGSFDNYIDDEHTSYMYNYVIIASVLIEYS